MRRAVVWRPVSSLSTGTPQLLIVPFHGQWTPRSPTGGIFASILSLNSLVTGADSGDGLEAVALDLGAGLSRGITDDRVVRIDALEHDALFPGPPVELRNRSASGLATR